MTCSQFEDCENTTILSIITVVYNDLPGLVRTIQSVHSLLGSEAVEHIVIDGSSTPDVKDFLVEKSIGFPKMIWKSEPDKGLYDAMNKGLKAAIGKFVIFMNAGDKFSSKFSFDMFKRYAFADGGNHVVIGRSLEVYLNDAYVRPALGAEAKIFSMPPHQATFYPVKFYSSNEYKLDKPVGADGDFTGRALDQCGGVFLPCVVCEFELGGRSSSYGNFRQLMVRHREATSVKAQIKLLLKAFLWLIIGQKNLYRVLAVGKYTRISKSEYSASLDIAPHKKIIRQPTAKIIGSSS
ncbi:glycosyltransferase [Leptothrix discophora]|nr:glycosyltransferase [Leptothrix discophora]